MSSEEGLTLGILDPERGLGSMDELLDVSDALE